jgi:DNA polymerase elongation subunit (family B)
LKEGKVPIEELVFTKQTSRDADDYYTVNTADDIAALRQLGAEGIHMRAGEVLRYVITEYYSKHTLAGGQYQLS